MHVRDFLLRVEKLVKKNSMTRWSEQRDLQDAILSYLVEDTNLIYFTCRVGQLLVDIYRVGRLTLS